MKSGLDAMPLFLLDDLLKNSCRDFLLKKQMALPIVYQTSPCYFIWGHDFGQLVHFRAKGKLATKGPQ
jgi:hypothetical protein